MSTQEPPASYVASLEAGDRALGDADWRGARKHFQAALRELHSGQALEGLATAAWWLDDVPALFEHRERAYAAYRDAGDQNGAARSAIWLALDYHIFRNANTIANGWIQRAQRILDDIDGPAFERSFLSFARGHIALENLDFEAVESHALDAQEHAQSVGAFDLEMLARALLGLGNVSTGAVDRGMSMLDEAAAAAISGEVADPDSVVTICCYLFYACERVQDFRRASEWCGILIELCRRWNYRSMVAVCRCHYASILIAQGQWEEAETELSTATDELLSTRAGWAAEGVIRLARLRALQGQFDRAQDALERVQDHPYSLLGRAELAYQRDELADAKDLVDRFLRRIPRRAVTDRLPALELRLQVALALNDVDDVDPTLDDLVDAATHIRTGPVRATITRARGRVAASRADYKSARQQLEDAIDIFVSSSAMYQAAMTRLELAQVLAAGKRERVAAAECGDAIILFERIGAKPALTRARGLLHRIAINEQDGASEPQPFPGLSRRESEILRLIALGQTNPDIAARLYLSVRTVERHVSSIYQKLGVEGPTARAIATAYALEHSSPERSEPN